MTRMVLVLLIATGIAWIGVRCAPGFWEHDGTEAREDRDLYYLLRPEGRPLRLSVQPGAVRVKLALYVVLERSAPLDPEYVVPFCLDAKLRGDGDALIWSRRLCYETARSGAVEPPDPDHPGPGRRVERARIRDVGGRLTDPRIEDFDLGVLSDDAGVLELRALPGVGQAVLVRPFRMEQLSSTQILLRLRGLPIAERRELAEAAGVSDWDELDPAEQRMLVSTRWLRQEALGTRGIDYEPVIVLTKDLPIATDLVGSGGRHTLEPGRGLAINLRGPVRARVLLDGATSIEMRSIFQRGRVRSRILETVDEVLEHEVRIPDPEVVTLSFVNIGGAPADLLVLTKDVPHGLFAGTEAAPARDLGEFALGPERISGRLSMLEPEQPMVLALPTDGPGRLRLRFRGDAGQALEVAIEGLDADGEVIFTETTTGTFAPSAFEEIRINRPGARYRPTSESLSRELYVSADTAFVRLHSTAPVWVRAQTPVADEWLPTRPAEDYVLEVDGVSLRYQPLVEWNWQNIRLDHRFRPEAIGAWGRFTAQVRLEPKGGPQPVDDDDSAATAVDSSSRGSAWRPEGEVRRLRIFERDADPAPGDGLWTMLTPGREQTLSFARSRPLLRVWRRGPNDTPIPVWVDDRQAELIPADAPYVDLRLPEVTPGRHRVRLGDGENEDLRALISASPPGGGGYRAKTLVRLGPDTDLTAAFDLPPGGRATVLLIPYFEPGTEPSEQAVLRYRVRSSAAGRRSGVFERTTSTAGRVPFGGPVKTVGFPAERSSATIARGRTVAVRVHEDLSGGRVRVGFRRDDGGPPIWARLVVSGVPAQKKEREAGEWVERTLEESGLAWVDPYEQHEGLTAVADEILDDPRGEWRKVPSDLTPSIRRFARILTVVAVQGRDDAVEELGRRAEALGFRLRAMRVGAERYLVLTGAVGDGRSALMLRVGPGADAVVLQTPHAFADLHTGRIGLRMFAQGGFRAWQLNTRHRYLRPGDPAPADAAHNADSDFQALMNGIMDGLTDGGEQGLVLQLHGFGRETVPEPEIRMILSGGAQGRHRAVDCFAEAIGDASGLALFGRDIDRLGGLTNVQGRALAETDEHLFLHLESSPEQRKSWLLDRAELDGLLKAVRAAGRCEADRGTE